jgi:hypothetical protein
MPSRVVFGMLALVVGAFGVASVFNTPAAVAEEKKTPTFKADIAPLFKNACAGCHSGLRQKARLDVTSFDSVMKKVKAGDPDRSKIHNCLIGKGAKRMPPKKPLSDDQIALVKAWIAAGAKKD